VPDRDRDPPAWTTAATFAGLALLLVYPLHVPSWNGDLGLPSAPARAETIAAGRRLRVPLEWKRVAAGGPSPVRPPAAVVASAHPGGTGTPNGVWGAPDGGVTLALLVDPEASGRVYAGTASGGVFTSTDGGRTWKSGSVGLPGARIGALAATGGTRPATLLAATVGAGVFRSRDGGATWSSASQGLVGHGALDVHALAVDSATGPGIVWAGTAGGPFASRDGGERWSPAGDQLAGVEVRALALARGATAPLLYAGTSRGLFRTADGGATWTPLRPGGAERPPVQAIALAVDPAHPGTVLAATHDEVLRTEDGGGTWRPFVRASLPRSLVIDAGGTPGRVYLGTAYRGVLTSTDGGRTWRESAAGLPRYAEVLTLALDPRTRTVYAGTSHLGVFRTRDGGESWQADDRGGTP
jgi:photosystem II stability/assembly factor-like uncharacterized protein